MTYIHSYLLVHIFDNTYFLFVIIKRFVFETTVIRAAGGLGLRWPLQWALRPPRNGEWRRETAWTRKTNKITKHYIRQTKKRPGPGARTSLHLAGRSACQDFGGSGIGRMV